jgi:hypothetical protein
LLDVAARRRCRPKESPPMKKNGKKSLRLNVETIRSLGTSSLAEVAGGLSSDVIGRCNLTLIKCQSDACATNVYCLSDVGLSSCC